VLYPALPNSHDDTLEKICPIITKGILENLWAYLCNKLTSSVKTRNDFWGHFSGK
jgi:hypothetical protein